MSASTVPRESPGGAFVKLLLFLVVSALAGLLVAGLALPVVGAVGLVGKKGADGFERLPEPLSIDPLSQNSRIVDSDGHTIATFYSENRITVPLANIAPVMQHAIVAVEDARFYEHGGIDLRGTTRAFVNNHTSNSVQGGSTLTQQYVKLVLQEKALAAGDEEAAKDATVRSGSEGYARKLREIRYAIALEKQYSKDEILERYLNIAYFGSGAYGIEAAARHYFSVSAKDLSLQQAATLAGVVQSPTTYDPSEHAQASRTRRDVVLSRMAKQGYITAAEESTAKATATKLSITKVPNGCSTSKAPYFCEYVRQEILHDPAFGDTAAERAEKLLRGGLIISTTLNSSMQKSAQESVDSHIPRKDKSRIATAISMVQPGTGAIVAMAQNRSWGTTNKAGVTTINYNVDRAYGGSTFGWQTGSTFKPFTAAAAIADGIPMNLRIDTPYTETFEDLTNCAGDSFKPYTLSNDSHSQPRNADFATGLALSMNTWAVGIEQRVGLCKVAQMAEKLGVHQGSGKDIDVYPSLTLGTNDVAPLTMAGAYATFAARGMFCQPYAITKVTNRAGQQVPHTATTCKQIMKKAVADAVNQLLVGVIDGPLRGRTGKAQSLGRPAAGKTGTTEENKDVWFAGYTPNMAAVVWVGDPGRVKKGKAVDRRVMQNITINGTYYSSGYGGTLAGPIWTDAMLAATKDLPEEDFVTPDPEVVRGVEIPVPYVRGLSASKALDKLARAGLVGEVAQTRVDNAQIAEGDVVYAYPGTGSSVPAGTTVKIYLSTGQAPPVQPTTPTATPTGPAAPATPVTPPVPPVVAPPPPAGG